MTDFDKWERVARAEVAAVEAEAEAEKAANDAAVGLRDAPASEAEAKDAAAHRELKKAKQRWQQREQAEQAAKYVVTRADATFAVQPEDLLNDDDAKSRSSPGVVPRRVLSLYSCSKCDVTLPASLDGVGVLSPGGAADNDSGAGLVKVFVEACEDVTIRLRCRLVTSFVEIARSARVTLLVEAPLHTVQCDLSAEVEVRWASGAVFDAAAPDGPRVYHAGCSALTVDAGAGRVAEKVADPADDAEAQSVTQLVDGVLRTERIVAAGDASRLVGATRRELDAEAAARASANKISTPPDAQRTAQADAEREKGNASFAQREYAQAVLHYTVALDHLGSCSAPSSDGHEASSSGAAPDDVAKLLANRAACFLKLGHPEKALDDAEGAVARSPAYAKAHFRQGLALHALERYQEALPALGRARDLEPANQQILDAIKFAEMRLARGPRSQHKGHIY